MTEEFRERARELIQAGRQLDNRGWTPATSGNLSARLSDGRIAITVSGRHKGRLGPEDIMLIGASGQSLDARKPSAEALLHTALYARDPTIGAVLHPHAPAATVLSRLFESRVILEGYELLKALPGIDSHVHRVVVPIFANDQNIARLAAKVNEYIDRHGDIPAYLIAGHGFYTWGATVRDALRHVEALEFLFDVEIRLRGARSR